MGFEVVRYSKERADSCFSSWHLKAPWQSKTAIIMSRLSIARKRNASTQKCPVLLSEVWPSRQIPPVELHSKSKTSREHETQLYAGSAQLKYAAGKAAVVQPAQRLGKGVGWRPVWDADDVTPQLDISLVLRNLASGAQDQYLKSFVSELGKIIVQEVSILFVIGLKLLSKMSVFEMFWDTLQITVRWSTNLCWDLFKLL